MASLARTWKVARRQHCEPCNPWFALSVLLAFVLIAPIAAGWRSRARRRGRKHGGKRPLSGALHS